MGKNEKIFNILMGMSVISWASFGIIIDIETAHISSVRISISVLNLFVGFRFLIRNRLVSQAKYSSILLSLPSFIAAGLAFKISPRTDTWPIYAELLFLCGASIAIVSFIFLGRNFSIFPSVRGIENRGPYRIVRHPAFLGEIIMITSCTIASINIAAIFIMIFSLVTIIIRIIAEEQVLKKVSAYRSYMKEVE